MSMESHTSDIKRIKLDIDEISDQKPLTLVTNGTFDDLLNSPSDTGENTSIISAFDHDSSSILSGSFYESSGEILSDTSIKSILKSSEFICKNINKVRNRIQFQEVEIFYFNRQQSFCSVPSIGGSALGMEMLHFLTETFLLEMDNDVFRSRKKHDSNSHDKSYKYSQEDYTILQPIVAKHRRILLKNSGTSRIETVDKEVCDLIRSSRERCGCQCVAGQCLPNTCSCVLNGIQCQVDRGNFPCGCGPNPCANPLGRVEFNPIRVRTHFIHTIMRLQMQDQYQSEEPKEIIKYTEIENNENSDNASKITREFDINTWNSTDQGSCRDCQNDKYLQVLMNEWTHQLQRLHTSKHYSPPVSIPYNSWTYLPETFYSTSYSDKDISMFPILPYPHYTLSNLPPLNLGLHQLYYHSTSSEQHYRSNNVLYSNHYVDDFNSRSNNVIFSCSDEYFKPINYMKHQNQEEPSAKSNSNTETTKIVEKQTLYNRSLEKEFSFQCKYSTNISSLQNESNLSQSSLLPYLPHKSSSYDDLSPMCTNSSVAWDDDPHHNKVTHASNGQLYTVLQPVSQSRIVSTFYQNYKTCDFCKICKYKSSDNRQPPNHLCISDFTLTSSIPNNLQIPLECSDHSQVCA